MSNIVSFPNAKIRKKTISKHKTLCKSGFHKWEVDNSKQFDVKQGRLVTAERCPRCGKTRTKFT
ncbi:MAG: hypothetical protein ACI915_005434 [Gammaproteobacteria bacterium]|jgi:hypothetical protein